MSTAKENELGAKEAKNVEQAMRFVEDPDLLAYVRAVGRRLAVHSPRHDVAYKFHVIDSADPNAFALPGGFVYVSRGLLAFTNSEEELANVVGHEIGHVAARHAVQRVTRATPIALATGVPALAVGIISPRMGRAVAQLGGVAGAVFLAPYSRGQENEADEIGQRIAASAGWDPAGMPRFLHAIERDEAHGSRPEGPGFLHSHPSTPERVRRTSKRATTLTPVEREPIASGRAAYVQKLEGLVVGENPATGIFRGQRLLHPDFDVTFEFPAGWTTQNVSELIGAQSPKGEAVAVLQVQGTDRDPVAAAQRFGAATKIDFSVEPGPAIVGRLPAAHAMAHMHGSQGDMLLDITWLIHRGMVFRIICASATSKAAAFRPSCLGIARSFRPLTAAERDGISVARLRAVRARKGERLDALVARTKSVWNVQQTAVANGVEEHAPLRGGQLLKVPVSERYVPGGPH
jgi:predicted Zn-dependent protease